MCEGGIDEDTRNHHFLATKQHALGFLITNSFLEPGAFQPSEKI